MSSKTETTTAEIACDGCGQPRRFDAVKNVFIPLKQCSRCHQSSYHDVECQKRHYKVHKLTCCRTRSDSLRPETKDVAVPVVDNRSNKNEVNEKFTVRKRPDGELGVFAARDIESNSSLSCRPLTPPVLLKNYRESRCACCFRLVTTIKDSFTLCSNPRYFVLLCSEECRKHCESWLPEETKIIEEMLCTDEDMFILPLAIASYRLLKAVPQNVYMAMRSHQTMIYEDHREVVHKQAIDCLVYSMMVKTPFNLSNEFFSQCVRHREIEPLDHIIKATDEILHRMKFNSFSIVDSSTDATEGIGTGLYVSPSHRINHSCRPNTVQTFVLEKGHCPQLDIRAARHIPKNQEIFIGYIETLEAPVEIRRQELLESYYFHCRCSRCMSEE